MADFDGLAAQICEVATALGLDRFHLMGTSLGGACALHFVTLFGRSCRVAGAGGAGQVPRGLGRIRRSSTPKRSSEAFRTHPERLPHLGPLDPEFLDRVWPTVIRLMGDGTDDGLADRLADVG